MPKSVVAEPSLGYDEWLRALDLAAGIVRVDQAIQEETAARFLSELEQVNRTQVTPITVVITSPGGSAYYALAMYDAIRRISESGVTVIARVEGWAASAAAMIVLQAADLRRAQPHARFLLHEVRRWVFWAMERTSEVEDEVVEMKAVEEQIVKILAARCNKTKDQVIETIRRREVWMSATEAKDWGLIDQIL